MNPHMILARLVQVNSVPGQTTVYKRVFNSSLVYNVTTAAAVRFKVQKMINSRQCVKK